jgi:hypothetical protein
MALTKRKPPSVAPPPMASGAASAIPMAPRMPAIDELGETLAQPVVDVEALQRAKLEEDARRQASTPQPSVPQPSVAPVAAPSFSPSRSRNATPTARAPRLHADEAVGPAAPESNAAKLVVMGLILVAVGGVLGLVALLLLT